MKKKPYTAWRSSSEEDRRHLFEAVDGLRWDRNQRWGDIVQDALGLEAYSEDLIKNFRRGKIARISANQIYKWLDGEAPEFREFVDEKIRQDERCRERRENPRAYRQRLQKNKQE